MKQTDRNTFIFPLFPAVNSVKILMSTRNAGSMLYIKNNGNPIRHAWLYSHGIHPQLCASLVLDHGKVVHVLNSSITQWNGVHGDGLIITDNAVYKAGAVTVADCVPIFLVHKMNKFIGILHSGFKGTGILENALTLITAQLSLSLEDIQIILGPHIHTCCYKVDCERALDFQKKYGCEAVNKINDVWYLNLAQANIVIAERLGCKEIWVAEDCTACNELYGSFRREKADNFTRMLAVISFF
mgnify:CR=1 FL=1